MATITKKLGFQNLIPFPSLNKDSDGNGVADGWVSIIPSLATVEWFIDEDGSQAINVLESTGQAFPGIRTSGLIPVVEGQTYTVSGEMRGMGTLYPGSMGTGPRLQIKWYNSSGTAIGDLFQPVQIVLEDEFTRFSASATAPTGAASCDVRCIFRVQQAGESGVVWCRSVQLQPGGTMTGFEQNDFFTIESPAVGPNPDYSFEEGWSITTSGGNRRLSSDQAQSSNGAYILFETPTEADNVQVSMDVDTTELSGTNDRFDLWYGANFLRAVNAGNIETVTVALPRGAIGLVLRHNRLSGTVSTNQIHVDNVEVKWDELTAPDPPPDPPKVDRVFSIDFEEDEIDPFFRLTKKAEGYSYGFMRDDSDRHSGWYALAVEETDVDLDKDSPPRIPFNAKAGASLTFEIPVTAIEPTLSLFAKFDSAEGSARGRVLLDGEEIWNHQTADGWHKIEVALAPGRHEVIFEYTASSPPFTVGTDTIYIDDISVRYNIPKKPYMVISTAPETEIRTEASNFSLTETFESSKINDFFTVTNPSRIDSPSTPTPSKGWTRSTQKAYAGSYGFRALLGLENGQSSAADFTFRVPLGVKNPRVRFRNYVGTKRAVAAVNNERYPRLYGEYRIWINRRTCWKEMNFASPALNQSVPYSTGDSGNTANDFACPWGKWWLETIELTPGRTYTLTFEYYLRSSGSAKTTSQNVMAIDNLQVTWEESAGDVLTIPAEPLVYLDNRDGYRWVDERSGAEMTGVAFNEYEVHGDPGSTYQSTRIDPRMVDLIVRINGESRGDLRQKIQELTTKISNRPLALQVVYPEGNARSLLCRFAPSGDWRETYRDNLGVWWRKLLLSFRAFDPFWYADPITVDGADRANPRWFTVINSGDVEVWPFIRIYGPINNPVVALTPSSTDSTVLESFQINVNLPAGNYIVVDTRPGRKSVMLDNGTNLYQWLPPTSKLFSIPQGQHGVRLTGSNTDANTRLIVEYSPPFWGW